METRRIGQGFCDRGAVDRGQVVTLGHVTHLLALLVEVAGVAEVPAQAIAIVAVTPFSFLATLLDRDNFIGRVLTGRVQSGTIKVNQPIHALDSDGKGPHHALCPSAKPVPTELDRGKAVEVPDEVWMKDPGWNCLRFLPSEPHWFQYEARRVDEKSRAQRHQQWAERRKLQTHPKTGAAQLVEIRETVQEILVPKYVESPRTAFKPKLLFAKVSDEDLLGFGEINALVNKDDGDASGGPGRTPGALTPCPISHPSSTNCAPSCDSRRIAWPTVTMESLAAPSGSEKRIATCDIAWAIMLISWPRQARLASR